jgi:hypothetical protein
MAVYGLSVGTGPEIAGVVGFVQVLYIKRRMNYIVHYRYMK